jgi:hypothetical protein
LESVADKKYLCDTCDFECKEKNDMKTHKVSYHEASLQCNKCDFKTADINELKNHKNDQHPPVIYSCEFCEFNTVHSNQLEKHTRINHSEDYICELCTFRAANARDLTNHKHTKHAPVFPCDFCIYKAFNKADLNLHIRVMHKDKQPTIYFNRTRLTSRLTENDSMYNTQKHVDEDTSMKSKHTDSEEETEDTSVLKKPFKCDKTCKMLQKTFTHKDELDLQIMFYHVATAPQ